MINKIFIKNISKHKCLEFQLFSTSISFFNRFSTTLDNRGCYFGIILLSCLFLLEIDGRWRDDHAGISLRIGLFGLEFDINLYDTRHWDFDNETYEK